MKSIILVTVANAFNIVSLKIASILGFYLSCLKKEVKETLFNAQ